MSRLFPVGLICGAGIPKGRRSRVYVECGCCGSYHRADFRGDCREDAERHADPGPDATRIITVEDTQ